MTPSGRETSWGRPGSGCGSAVLFIKVMTGRCWLIMVKKTWGKPLLLDFLKFNWIGWREPLYDNERSNMNIRCILYGTLCDESREYFRFSISDLEGTVCTSFMIFIGLLWNQDANGLWKGLRCANTFGMQWVVFVLAKVFWTYWFPVFKEWVKVQLFRCSAKVKGKWMIYSCEVGRSGNTEYSPKTPCAGQWFGTELF